LLSGAIAISVQRLNKAFTRESDDATEPPIRPRPPPPLPPGVKNYLTAEGARRLQAELDRLTQIERPQLSTAKDDPDARRQLQSLDQRIQHLHQTLGTAVVVPLPSVPWEQVRFGATVTVRSPSSGETRYRIVGIDETDVDRNWVSWLSPIARAMLNATLANACASIPPPVKRNWKSWALNTSSQVQNCSGAMRLPRRQAFWPFCGVVIVRIDNSLNVF
jgi:transcription elongation factor GreB